MTASFLLWCPMAVLWLCVQVSVSMSTMIDTNVIILSNDIIRLHVSVIFSHIFGCMRWDEMRFLHLIMSFLLYQYGRTAYQFAICNGHTEIKSLLRDKGARVYWIDKASESSHRNNWLCKWLFTAIMIWNGSVIVMSTSQRHH